MGSTNTTFSMQLWQQCEQQYQVDPKAYIALQDDYQVNVNLLLLAQRLDQQGYLLNLPHWQQLTAVIEQWETKVLTPYRQLRRIAKAHLAASEYQKMLDVELIMERKSQKILLQQVNLVQGEPMLANTNNSATNNTDHYLSLFGLNSTHLPQSISQR